MRQHISTRKVGSIEFMHLHKLKRSSAISFSCSNSLPGCSLSQFPSMATSSSSLQVMICEYSFSWSRFSSSVKIYKNSGRLSESQQSSSLLMFDPSLLLCSWISSSIGSSKLYSPDFGSFSSLRFDFDCFVSYYSSSDSVFQSSFSGSSSTTFMLSLSNFLMGKYRSFSKMSLMISMSFSRSSLRMGFSSNSSQGFLGTFSSSLERSWMRQRWLILAGVGLRSQPICWSRNCSMLALGQRLLIWMKRLRWQEWTFSGCADSLAMARSATSLSLVFSLRSRLISSVWISRCLFSTMISTSRSCYLWPSSWFLPTRISSDMFSFSAKYMKSSFLPWFLSRSWKMERARLLMSREHSALRVSSCFTRSSRKTISVKRTCSICSFPWLSSSTNFLDRLMSRARMSSSSFLSVSSFLAPYSSADSLSDNFFSTTMYLRKAEMKVSSSSLILRTDSAREQRLMSLETLRMSMQVAMTSKAFFRPILFMYPARFRTRPFRMLTSPSGPSSSLSFFRRAKAQSTSAESDSTSGLSKKSREASERTAGKAFKNLQNRCVPSRYTSGSLAGLSRVEKDTIVSVSCSKEVLFSILSRLSRKSATSLTLARMSFCRAGSPACSMMKLPSSPRRVAIWKLQIQLAKKPGYLVLNLERELLGWRRQGTMIFSMMRVQISLPGASRMLLLQKPRQTWRQLRLISSSRLRLKMSKWMLRMVRISSIRRNRSSSPMMFLGMLSVVFRPWLYLSMLAMASTVSPFLCRYLSKQLSIFSDSLKLMVSLKMRLIQSSESPFSMLNSISLSSADSGQSYHLKLMVSLQFWQKSSMFLKQGFWSSLGSFMLSLDSSDFTQSMLVSMLVGTISGRLMYSSSRLHSSRKQRMTCRYSARSTLSRCGLPLRCTRRQGRRSSLSTLTIWKRVFLTSARMSSEISMKQRRGMQRRMSGGKSQFSCSQLRYISLRSSLMRMQTRCTSTPPCEKASLLFSWMHMSTPTSPFTLWCSSRYLLLAQAFSQLTLGTSSNTPASSSSPFTTPMQLKTMSIISSSICGTSLRLGKGSLWSSRVQRRLMRSELCLAWRSRRWYISSSWTWSWKMRCASRCSRWKLVKMYSWKTSAPRRSTPRKYRPFIASMNSRRSFSSTSARPHPSTTAFTRNTLSPRVSGRSPRRSSMSRSQTSRRWGLRLRRLLRRFWQQGWLPPRETGCLPEERLGLSLLRRSELTSWFSVLARSHSSLGLVTKVQVRLIVSSSAASNPPSPSPSLLKKVCIPWSSTTSRYPSSCPSSPSNSRPRSARCWRVRAAEGAKLARSCAWVSAKACWRRRMKPLERMMLAVRNLSMRQMKGNSSCRQRRRWEAGGTAREAVREDFQDSKTSMEFCVGGGVRRGSSRTRTASSRSSCSTATATPTRMTRKKTSIIIHTHQAAPNYPSPHPTPEQHLHFKPTTTYLFLPYLPAPYTLILLMGQTIEPRQGERQNNHRSSDFRRFQQVIRRSSRSSTDTRGAFRKVVIVSSSPALVISRNIGGSAFSRVSCSSSSVRTEGCEVRVKQNLGVGTGSSGCVRMRSRCSTNSNSSPSASRSCSCTMFLFCCRVFSKQSARSSQLSCWMSCSRLASAYVPSMPPRIAWASPIWFQSAQQALWILRAQLWQNLKSLGQKQPRSRLRLSPRASAMGRQDLRMNLQTAGSWLVRAVTHLTRFMRIQTSGGARGLSPPRRRLAQKSKREAIFWRYSTQGRTMSSSRNISLLNSTCQKRYDQSEFSTADFDTLRSLRALTFRSCSHIVFPCPRTLFKNSNTTSVAPTLGVACIHACRKRSALMALRGVRVCWASICRCWRIW